jgi:hypothetical protein
LYDRAVTSRQWTILLTLLIVFTAARVATTYRVFSPTMDPPFHVAAGYDFLLTGRQTSDPQHPPLARVFFALPFVRTTPPDIRRPRDFRRRYNRRLGLVHRCSHSATALEHVFRRTYWTIDVTQWLSALA